MTSGLGCSWQAIFWVEDFLAGKSNILFRCERILEAVRPEDRWAPWQQTPARVVRDRPERRHVAAGIAQSPPRPGRRAIGKLYRHPRALSMCQVRERNFEIGRRSACAFDLQRLPPTRRLDGAGPATAAWPPRYSLPSPAANGGSSDPMSRSVSAGQPATGGASVQNSALGQPRSWRCRGRSLRGIE